MLDDLLNGGQVFRLRDHRHGELVLQRARLQQLEGRLADQDGLSVLDGLHRAHSETAPISSAVHLVQNRYLRVSWKKRKEK